MKVEPFGDDGSTKGGGGGGGGEMEQIADGGQAFFFRGFRMSKR
jgi:hypothetical protein